MQIRSHIYIYIYIPQLLSIVYRTGRFIGEDFILAIGDLFNFSPIFKTPTKYIRLLINNN